MRSLRAVVEGTGQVIEAGSEVVENVPDLKGP
jgi:hypothetical protein